MLMNFMEGHLYLDNWKLNKLDSSNNQVVYLKIIIDKGPLDIFKTQLSLDHFITDAGSVSNINMKFYDMYWNPLPANDYFLKSNVHVISPDSTVHETATKQPLVSGQTYGSLVF
jgi:hypothetical protein